MQSYKPYLILVLASCSRKSLAALTSVEDDATNIEQDAFTEFPSLFADTFDRYLPLSLTADDIDCLHMLRPMAWFAHLIPLLLMIAVACLLVLELIRFHLQATFQKAESPMLLKRKRSVVSLLNLHKLVTQSDDNNASPKDDLEISPGHLHSLYGKKEKVLLPSGESSGLFDELCYSVQASNEDIMLDKDGFDDICPPSPELTIELIETSRRRLSPVPERLCDDTLEDTKAFADVRIEKLDEWMKDHEMLKIIQECDNDIAEEAKKLPQ